MKGAIVLKHHFLTKEQALFLIVDLQENLMKVMAHAEQVYKNTQLLLAVCERLKIPVLVTEQYPQGLGRTVPAIKKHLGRHLLLEKKTFSLVNKDTLDRMRAYNRQQILVVGSETHVCVFQTVRDLVAAGFDLFVLKDGVCSRRKQNYKTGLQLMKEEGAVLTDTETAIFDLLKTGASEDFKAVLPLIKRISLS